MAIYCFVCREHETEDEVLCQWTQLDRMRPHCPQCGKPMDRDYTTERFGGVTYRNKGVMGYIDENISKDGKPVYMESHQQRKRLMRENGRIEYEMPAEVVYREKHKLDRAVKRCNS